MNMISIYFTLRSCPFMPKNGSLKGPVGFFKVRNIYKVVRRYKENCVCTIELKDGARRLIERVSRGMNKYIRVKIPFISIHISTKKKIP